MIENPSLVEEEVFDDRGAGISFLGSIGLNSDEDLQEFRKLILDFGMKQMDKYDSEAKGIIHTVTLSVFPLKKIFPEGIDSVQK
jgi:hypothetical protein